MQRGEERGKTGKSFLHALKARAEPPIQVPGEVLLLGGGGVESVHPLDSVWIEVLPESNVIPSSGCVSLITALKTTTPLYLNARKQYPCCIDWSGRETPSLLCPWALSIL